MKCKRPGLKLVDNKGRMAREISYTLSENRSVGPPQGFVGPLYVSHRN